MEIIYYWFIKLKIFIHKFIFKNKKDTQSTECELECDGMATPPKV